MSVALVSHVAGISQETRRISKTITLDGTAGLGAVGAVPIWTVTGEVEVMSLSAICAVDLVSAGGGTLALGVTGSTALFIAATTATAIDVGEFWLTVTPTANGIAIPAALKNIAITDNIIGTVAVGDITAGSIRFDLYYRQLSVDGSVL